MRDAAEQKVGVPPKSIEQSYEDWLAGFTRDLPKGFAESHFAQDYWQRGVNISLAVYNFKLHTKSGIKTANLLPVKKGE